MTRLTCAFGSCDGAPRFKVVPIMIDDSYALSGLGVSPAQGLRIIKVTDHQYTCGRHLAQVTGAFLTDHDQVIVSRLGVPLLGTLRTAESPAEPRSGLPATPGEGTGVDHVRAA